jgi:N-acetylmuramoyl-L-alanine amidase
VLLLRSLGSLLLTTTLVVGAGLMTDHSAAPVALPLTVDPIPVAARVWAPLDGRVVVLDAGHQLGNHNFPAKINRLVPAGGFQKACNSTGTATNGGFPEATFAFRVTKLLQARLERAGARVILTRATNRQDRWGPCVSTRGRAGNKAAADLKISIHGDGSTSGGPGFHVIAPTDRKPWTHDIYTSSRRLAITVRRAFTQAGLPRAGYIAGGDGLDFRSDLGTLNLSDVTTVMVECGNMRATRDAKRMTTRRGQTAYARALARAVRRYLG